MTSDRLSGHSSNCTGASAADVSEAMATTPSRKRQSLCATDASNAAEPTIAEHARTSIDDGGSTGRRVRRRPPIEESAPLGSEFDATVVDKDEALAKLEAMNFYAALGTSPGATNAEIRKAFKKQASGHHPDNGGDPRAYRHLSKVKDILLSKARREKYDFHGRDAFADMFAESSGGGGEAADDGASRLPGQRIIFAPVSDMVEKIAADEAWAKQRWGHDANGYRFDVLASIVLKRVEAAGPSTGAARRATRDVYRLGHNAVSLGIRESRLVSGRPAEGGGPSSLQREIDLGVPSSLAGLSAAQTKSTFRAVVLFGCVEFDLVASWLFCARELAAQLGLDVPTMRRIAVDGLTLEGEPLHAEQRRRLAEDAGVSDKIIKCVLQRLIGGGRWPAQMFLSEHGGHFSRELLNLDGELERVCARNFENASPKQRDALADKPRPDRSFLAHTLMQIEKPKVDRMEQVAALHGADLCGLLGDATIHPPGSLEAIRKAQRELADVGITTSLKPLAGDCPEDLVKFLYGKGIEVGKPAPSRAMPSHGLRWAEAWVKANSHAYSGHPGDAPHGSYATIAAGRWDVRRLQEDSWAMLDEKTNVWEVSKGTLGLAGEKTTQYLQEELRGFEFDQVVGDNGKFKLIPRKKPFPNNVLEDDQFLKHVASQIKEKSWPRMQTHPKEGSVTAFANGMSVDWDEPDPFSAYVATRKEWNLVRRSKSHVEPFSEYLEHRKGCDAESAKAIATKWLSFTDMIIKEKVAALQEQRDVDFEQHRAVLEELLDDYPCVKHIFWEPFLSVRDMYCALQIRADAFSGKHQRAKRITAFCEFGCASANKGGRRDMDEQTFGTHVPPEQMGFVFKITSAQMCAKSQRGPWESAANAEGSRLGYSDEWTRSTRMNNATFKAFHAGNSIDFDRKHKGMRQIDVPPPLIYLANEGFRFQDPVVDGEDRRLQIVTCKRRIVPADQFDPEDETHILKDPSIKAASKQWMHEYVWVLLCVARGCDIAQDDLPFPAPSSSKESVAELIETAGPMATVNNQSVAEDFVNECLIHCPASAEPTSRRDVLRALCAFAAKPPYFSRSTRDALQRSLELLVENPGGVSILLPKKRTVYPYLARTGDAKAHKTSRMLRLRTEQDCKAQTDPEST